VSRALRQQPRLGPSASIPDGIVLDHMWPRCTLRSCQNKAHLEIVTVAENMRRVQVKAGAMMDGPMET
jgi:hypothetical protein